MIRSSFIFLLCFISISIFAQPNRGEVSFVGNKFIWTGTEEAFVPNYLMIEMFADDLSQVNEKNLDAFIQEFTLEHGFNGLHVPVMGQWFHIGQKSVSSNDSIPDEQTFQKLKLIINKMYEAGGCTHLWLWGDAQRNQTAASTKGGIMGKQEKVLLDKIAEELGPLHGWSMSYGFDLWEWVSEAELDAWYNYMWSKPNCNHLLGARASKNKLDQLSEQMDYASYEYHKPWYNELRKMINKRPDKPSFSEDRYRIRNPSKYPDKDYNAEETRRGLWHHTMAGGIAAIWGNLIDDGKYENKELINTFFTFWNVKKRFHKDMEASSNGSTYCLGKAGKYYVFYQENTSSITCKTEEGEYQGIAVDTLKPYQEIDLGRIAKDIYNFKAPYKSDWAIYLSK